jgi:hypothetical protein
LGGREEHVSETDDGIRRLTCCKDDDYPMINWSRHADMAALWLEVDDRQRAGQPFAAILERIRYRLSPPRHWKQADCLMMVPGIGVSARARGALEALGVRGMRFLPFTVNSQPWFLFYTERVVDCLNRSESEIVFFPSSRRVMHVRRYAFDSNRLEACDVFAIPELSNGMFFWSQETFLTAAAAARLSRSGIIGFDLERVSS